jgi:hypothetical protein
MRIKTFFAAALLAVTFSIIHAASPTFWQVATQADFLKGEVENLSIDSDGRLVLGPANELVHETAAPFLWALISTADGALWAGSGNEGKVFRVGADGKASTVFDATELEAHALTPAPGGGVFAATSPEGKIYRIAADGTSSTFFDPDDKYIWSLATGRNGELYAATGDKGVIYKIDAEGKGKPFYKTKATHVVALAVDREGNVLAGTESPGQVLRIDPQGKAFVLLDSSFREIRALRLDDKGLIYAAAISGRSPSESMPSERPTPEPSRPSPVPTVSTEITAVAIGDVSAPSAAGGSPSPRRESRRSPKGAVYRITPDGVSDMIWDSSEDTPYDLAIEGSAVLIGTGGKGKIFRVAGDPGRASLVARADAQQITTFLRDAKGRTHYATSNPGKIFRLSSDRADRGTYQSEIKDAETVAAWGTLRWRATTPAGAHIQLSTRSGNTSVPDDTWSDWSAPHRNADGEQITSPKARYLQWRATLSGKDASPVLTSVTTAYLPRNLRPSVASITVHPPGTVFQKPFSTGEMEIAGYDDGAGEGRLPSPAATATSMQQAPPLGRRVYQKGFQTFAWKASDENDDRMQYDAFYRREGETAWRPLRRALNDPIFVWDTTSVPDGTYLLKIVASDAPSNSPGTALTGELETTTFDIDNTPPRIEVSGIRRDGPKTVVTFTVRDEQSPVQRVEYSLDANRWRVTYPKDGIPDSRSEPFELSIEGEAAARSVIIRATDAMNNSATAVAEATRP